jgi:hypothetical protein
MAEGSGSRFGQASMSMRNGTPRDKAVYANSSGASAEPPKKRQCATKGCKNFLRASRPKKDKFCAICEAAAVRGALHGTVLVKEKPVKVGATYVAPISQRFRLTPASSPPVPPTTAPKRALA